MEEKTQRVIGLGLDHRVDHLKQMGVSTYQSWYRHGFTRVDPIEANLSPTKFAQGFAEAADSAEGIYFDLTDLDIRQALSEGPQGFVFHNYTNAELFRILQKPEWLAKTGFYRNSQPTSLAGNLTEGGHSWISAMNTARPRKRSSLHSQSGVAAGPESGSTRPRCRG